MQRYALTQNGVVRRVALTKPHPTALPVEFPELDVTPDTHHIALNPAEQWGVYEDKVVATYTITERDFEAEAEAEKQRKVDALADLAEYRFAIETGGITLPDGTRVLTDRESQGQLANAYQSLSQPFVNAIDWKADGGWITITEPELRPIAQAVAQHVQGCFTAERRVSEQIEAGEVLDVRAAFDEALVGVLAG